MEFWDRLLFRERFLVLLVPSVPFPAACSITPDRGELFFFFSTSSKRVDIGFSFQMRVPQISHKAHCVSQSFIKNFHGLEPYLKGTQEEKHVTSTAANFVLLHNRKDK